MLSDHAYLKTLFIRSESALEVVDGALMSATKAEKKTSEEADKAFEYTQSIDWATMN